MASINIATEAETIFRTKLNEIFGTGGKLLKVESINSGEWQGLKELKAKELLVALTSSDQEFFKLPKTSNTLDTPKLRLAEAIKDWRDKTGIEPSQHETTERFLRAVSMEQAKKDFRLGAAA